MNGSMYKSESTNQKNELLNTSMNESMSKSINE